ncbi:hypothetical protein [Sphingomonas sp.]|uniref:hypothetical protein n=1 Tax=Sphingomonas sp. TaxID=28214 RepID=UPI0025F4E333|nr:hypothetical protein [Sphingomonas sp.]
MSIHTSARGLPVTTSSSALAQALHAFEEQVLDYGNQAAALFDALPLDPDCALANAYAAALHLFRSTREGQIRARPFATAAKRLSAQTARERRLIAAVERWSAQDVPGAIHILDRAVLAEPTDLFAVKLHQHLLFSTGASGAMLAAVGPVAAAVPNEPRVLGMLAFALDQTGSHREAERAARAAVEIAPDPWAHHAIAHVMDAERRHDEGRSWMLAHADAWAHCTSFLYTHNWWHAALFHLALDDRDGAMALYHERIWAMRRDYVQDQVNAISLLARLELVGVDVGDRWQEVADYVRPRRFDALEGFLDLHYAYALARAGDDESVGDLLGALRARAETKTGTGAGRVALVAGEAMVAYARSDYQTAARRLGSVVADISLLGGSTVQRQLFSTLLTSARAGGHRSLELAA